MRKIASPNELASELQSLLSYAESPSPSRVRLASALNQLADRVGGFWDPETVLLQAKKEKKVSALVRLSRSTRVKWRDTEVDVGFDSESDANNFEDHANRLLGLTGRSDPYNTFTVDGTQNAKDKYTITIGW